MITIYVLTYNEELILPYFIKHYRARFHDCDIKIFDNFSTDDTIKIGEENNCDIIQHDSNNKIDERIYLSIKNECWKTSKTDWNIICDADEFLDIDERDINYETIYNDSNIIKSTAYHMINLEENDLDIDKICYGVRATDYDKCLIFNKKYIKEINYSPGCHNCFPVAHNNKDIKFNKKIYNLYHMTYLDKKTYYNKCKRNKERLSGMNLKKRWGYHYLMNEKEVEQLFEKNKKIAQKVR